MLTLLEQHELSRTIETLDMYITDDVYDKAEYYEVEEDEETLVTTIKLFNEEGEELVAVEVDDYDAAVEILADMFDVEDAEEDLYADIDMDEYNSEEYGDDDYFDNDGDLYA